MLLPLLRDVRAGESADSWPTLMRCTWCKQRRVVRAAGTDELAARRAEALAFVTRGSRTEPSGVTSPAAKPVELVPQLPPVVER